MVVGGSVVQHPFAVSACMCSLFTHGVCTSDTPWPQHPFTHSSLLFRRRRADYVGQEDYLAPEDSDRFESLSYHKQDPYELPEYARGKVLNRYGDILPNPKTRVKLEVCTNPRRRRHCAIASLSLLLCRALAF
jgi:hypothetical protein